MLDPRDVQDIFARASELTSSERPTFLDQACGDRTALRREVERLLSAHDQFGTAMDAFVDTRHDGPRDGYTVAPEHVGPYRVVKELGRGGVGAVFLAIRKDDYTKSVAIKLLKFGAESEEIVRRFRVERQILATIEHPHIAKLLDGGTLDDGRPYLVMEYIDGQPIDAYCERERLTVAQRLDLFCKVCDAVQFAHQNLVVHRDLKPGNILVTGDGTPKLLDFGIAKLLEPSSFQVTVEATRTESRMMTPEYASPEQVKGEPTATATDVYSLGVLLYRLLTGHSPYRLRTGHFQELAQAICEQEPTRPSSVIDIEEDTVAADGRTERLTAESVSQSREGNRERLRRRLRGDIEHIVLRAMRKEPQSRYASAEQFSDDIRRYRENLPVRARRGTWTYHTSRFVARHRIALGAASVVALAMLVAIVITVGERRRAERESERARAVIAFLTTALRAVDPRIAQGDEPTVRQLLDEAESRVAGLPPQDQLAVREVIAESRLNMGHVRLARDQYATLADTYRSALGPQHRDTLAALVGLAASQADLGELDAAEKTSRAAVDGYRAHASREPRGTVRSANTLAAVLLRLGTPDRIEEADGVLARAVSTGASLTPADPERLSSQHLLAQLRLAQSRPQDAETAAWVSYRATLASLGPRHPLVLESVDTLSNALLSLSKYDDVVAMQRRHLDEVRMVLGDEHAVTLRMQHTIAETLRHLDRFNEAEALYQQVLATKKRVLGDRHRSTLLTRHNMALLMKDLGRPQLAETQLREISGLRREVLGPDHIDTLDSEMMIALTLFEQKRLEESRDAYAAVLPRIKASIGESAESYLVGTANYAGLLYRLGDYEAAERTLRQSLDAHRRVYGDRYFGTYYTMTELGTTLVLRQQFEEAERLLIAAMEGFRQIYAQQPSHNRVRQGYDRLARLYKAWNKPEKAAEYTALLTKATADAARSAAK